MTLYRTWPYGTRKSVKVLSVIVTSTSITLVCVDEEEGYVCLYPRGHSQAVETAQGGDRGTIIFVKGGLHGGMWDYLGKDDSQ